MTQSFWDEESLAAAQTEAEEAPETEFNPEHLEGPPSEPVVTEEATVSQESVDPAAVVEEQVSEVAVEEESLAQQNAEAAQPVEVAADQVSAAQVQSVALSVDEFGALEERVLRAVSLVKRERDARAGAEVRAEAADALIRDQAIRIDRLERENEVLRQERDQVRQRVEYLLSQLDLLES